MPRFASLLALGATLAASTAMPAHADQVFNRIATFPVASNLPADADIKTPTSSEIIAASDDGNLLVYSDSPLGAVGFIDITDPKAPKAGGSIKADGEPTSVTVAGGKVLAGVNTSKSKAEPSGKLLAIDIASKAIETTCDLGGQPDSVALSKDGKFLAVAIENERDEKVNDGQIPQMPGGNLKIVPINAGVPDCAGIKTVELTGLAAIAPEDPEPEFVAFNEAGEIAVTLQENNHIAIVDAATAKVLSHFSAGAVTLDKIDTEKDGAFKFDGSKENVLREPDTVKWIDNDRLVTANEGDLDGGSRGFTIFTKDGKVAYESGTNFEYEVAKAGHYPEARNKKGVEPEGVEVAAFGQDKLIFVASERGSVVGVYKDTGGEPQFLQLLPSGIGPEGVVAIPPRNLLVTANETDLIEDNLARSHVMIYERAEGTPAYPQITSDLTSGGVPLGWGALSGLAADPATPGKLFAVSDSAYDGQPSIYAIDATKTPAMITEKTVVTRNGAVAEKLDLEGIVADGAGGFWLASEGDPEKEVPHGVLHVDAKGAIVEEVSFPEALLAGQTRSALEGITMVGSGDDAMLVTAVQREWKDDPKGQVKLLAYKPTSKEWSAVRYPLNKTGAGWVGLSEIVAYDGTLYVIERDNQIGGEAKLKAVYAVDLANFKPAALGGELPVVEKTLVRDLIPDLKAATNGYVVDKVEGMTFDSAGDLFIVTDNDGVDDSSGETLFLKLGKLATN